MKSTNLCEIVSIECIAPDIYDMRVKNEKMCAEAQPGQFVNIKCGDDINTLLRRPISICDVCGDTMRLIFQKKGDGTALLAEKKVGDVLDIMGPQGKGFRIAEGKKCAVIGGGIGTFPLYMLTKSLNNADVYLGFRNKDLVVMEEEFKAISANVNIATDDGTYGYNGFAINLLKENLEGVEMIYACGPKPMLKSVQQLSKETGIPAQISLEQRMGCGIGACLVCACKVGDRYAHVCKAGPVFNANEVNLDD